MCQRTSFVPDCDCDDCMPAGCDGAEHDTLDAALVAASRNGLRGGYHVRMTAGAVTVQWYAADGAPPPRIEREALYAAAHELRRRGRKGQVPPGINALLVAA